MTYVEFQLSLQFNCEILREELGLIRTHYMHVQNCEKNKLDKKVKWGIV